MLAGTTVSTISALQVVGGGVKKKKRKKKKKKNPATDNHKKKQKKKKKKKRCRPKVELIQGFEPAAPAPCKGIVIRRMDTFHSNIVDLQNETGRSKLLNRCAQSDQTKTSSQTHKKKIQFTKAVIGRQLCRRHCTDRREHRRRPRAR
jgi:hypothetical protein